RLRGDPPGARLRQRDPDPADRTGRLRRSRAVGSIATIGVYGFDRETFLATLSEAKVELLLDVRQRRAVRGSEYAWANSRRLQAALAGAGIGYEHRKELAPTTELRQILYAADAERGEGKRSRTVLDPEFVARYEGEILDQADLASIAGSLEATVGT